MLPVTSPGPSLHELEAKTFRHVMLSPDGAELDDRAYGDVGEAEFQEFSLESTELCTKMLRVGLARKSDPATLFSEINRFLGARRHELAVKSKSPRPEIFGELRTDPSLYSYTGVGEGTPYVEQAKEIYKLFAGFRFKGNVLSMSERKGDSHVSLELWSPESYAEKIAQAASVHEAWSQGGHSTPCERTSEQILLEDSITMCRDIFGMTYRKDNPERVIKFVDASGHERIQVAPEYGSDWLQKLQSTYFAVGRISRLVQNSLEVIVSYFFCLDREENRLFLKTSRNIGVLHPHLPALTKMNLECAALLFEILLWDGKERVWLKSKMCRFTHLYLLAMNYYRGTAWCMQVFTKALYKFHHFRLTAYAPGIDLGQETLSYPLLHEFAANYVRFHAEDPTSHRQCRC